MTISVRPISTEQHLAVIRRLGAASFLQTPAWARVKSEWRGESLGWFDSTVGEEPVGAGLVLYRQLPRVKRYFAYFPEGPVLDWASITDLAAYLSPMVAHLRHSRVFGVRIGPTQVHRRWSKDQIKAAVADEAVRSLVEVPTETVGLPRWDPAPRDQARAKPYPRFFGFSRNLHK